MARDSSSGFRRGITHFFTATRNTTEGVGEKEQTNEQYGLGSVPSASRVVLWYVFVQLFVHFADYRGRIFFAKLLQRPRGIPTHLWPSSSLPPSADRCQMPPCISLYQLTLSEFLCQLPLWLLSDIASPTSGLVGVESKPFVWFRAKTDKGIVCLADHPRSVTVYRDLSV